MFVHRSFGNSFQLRENMQAMNQHVLFRGLLDPLQLLLMTKWPFRSLPEFDLVLLVRIVEHVRTLRRFSVFGRYLLRADFSL